MRHLYHKTGHNLPEEVVRLIRPRGKPLASHSVEIRAVDGRAYLVFSVFLLDGLADQRAALILIQPLDDQFLFAFQNRHHSKSIVVFTNDANGLLLASSRPDLISAGSALESLKDRYVVEMKPFFDNTGISSDIFIQFASLIPQGELYHMSHAILEESRKQKLLSLLALIFTFALMLLWISRRLGGLSADVVDYARNSLDVSLPSLKRGDSLENLRT